MPGNTDLTCCGHYIPQRLRDRIEWCPFGEISGCQAKQTKWDTKIPYSNVCYLMEQCSPIYKRNLHTGDIESLNMSGYKNRRIYFKQTLVHIESEIGVCSLVL